MNWQDWIEKEKQQEYLQKIMGYIAEKRAAGVNIYPADNDLFNAFALTSFANTKVVIIGQDPYHGKGQAHGLSFSVRPDIKIPRSLSNIYKELAFEYPDFVIPEHGYLEKWATQGVLMINAVLSVEAAKAGSHSKLGWEEFTNKVIAKISAEKKGVVFLLWGKFAESKAYLIDTNNHYILTTSHPSPFSARRGFLGCRHFIKTNELLVSQGKEPISWQV